IEKTLNVTGTIQPLRERQAALSAPVAGVLDSLPVRTGQSVSRGEMVAHLSTRLLEGQIAQARAAIAQSRIQVEQARANALQRQAVEAQRDTVTGQEQTVAAARAARLQDTVKQKDIQIAAEQLQSARGALAAAQAQASLYTLCAPISGIVTGVGASLGETVDT